jgi:hypothetical protein
MYRRGRMTLEVAEWTPGAWADGVPRAPAVYAMYAGEPPRAWVAYVGMAGDLHLRLFQHFVRRDSSVVAAAAVRLDLDYIRYVEWWEHAYFSDGARRHAAELVAFDVFEPVLRSRGNPSRAAMKLYDDPSFRAELEGIFKAAPAGRLHHVRLPDVARQVHYLEARIRALEEAREAD